MFEVIQKRVAVEVLSKLDRFLREEEYESDSIQQDLEDVIDGNLVDTFGTECINIMREFIRNAERMFLCFYTRAMYILHIL